MQTAETQFDFKLFIAEWVVFTLLVIAQSGNPVRLGNSKYSQM